MSKLSSLRGSVTVEIEGVDGAGIATFEVPIVVLEQSRQGDVHAVAVGTPDGAIRAGVRAALAQALEVVLGNIPSAEVTPAEGGVLPSFAATVASDLPEGCYVPLPPAPGPSEAIWAEADRRISAEGVGGSHP